ncbi:MAG: HTH-type transcriptional regulator Cmr [Pseudomonadota bacterium]|jgi:CRP-like cAMP-binding protein
MSNALHFCSRRNPVHASLLAGLDPAALAPFLERAVARNFADGQIIQQQGEAGDGCWIVIAGQVKIGQFVPAGKFVTLTMIVGGESYGELALLRRRQRAVDAVAVGPTRLWWIAAAHFEAVLAEHPGTMRSLLALLGDQLLYTMQNLLAVRGKHATQLLAAKLAEISDTMAPPARIMMTQQDLAELAGVTRATVSKALAAFVRAGALRQGYGFIEVSDPARLHQIAAGA